MLKKVLEMCKYYKPYKLIVFIDMIFATIIAVSAVITPKIISYILDSVIDKNFSVYYKIFVKYSIILIIIVIIQTIASYFVGVYTHILGAKIERDLRKKLFDHYQTLPIEFFNNSKVGELLSHIVNDLIDISEVLHKAPGEFIIIFIKLSGATYFLIKIFKDIKNLIILGIIGCIVLLTVLSKYFLVRINLLFRIQKEKLADINALVEDSLSGIRETKLFVNQNLEKNRFKSVNNRFLNVQRTSFLYTGIYKTFMECGISFLNILVLIIGIIFFIKGKITAGILAASCLHIKNIIDPIKKLFKFLEYFNVWGYAGFCKFLEVLNIKPMIKEVENPIELGEVKGDISFKNVKFRYKDENKYILNNFNLEIKAGEHIGIIGPSGSGKTTIINLLVRFFDVNEGIITIDGKNIKNLKKDELRKNIAIVQQDMYLFAVSIKENILYGKPDATEEDIKKAAYIAGVDEFIDTLENGYDTLVGQRGVRLSGGQKQRICIARTIIKDPKIIVFDEATSALDSKNEDRLNVILSEFIKNKTTIMVSHKFSMITKCDKIIVLTKDGIVEAGNHSELMKNNGLYKKMYDIQFKEKK